MSVGAVQPTIPVDFLGASARLSPPELALSAQTKRGNLDRRLPRDLQLVSSDEPDHPPPVAFDSPAASAAMRLEAPSWPRLIYAPVKRSGHVVLDACTPAGTIQRFVCSKRQGKQVYADARKARWGDAFPHPPGNTPVVRERGIRKLLRSGHTPGVQPNGGGGGRNRAARPRDADLKERRAFVQKREAERADADAVERDGRFGSLLLHVGDDAPEDDALLMRTTGAFDVAEPVKP